MRRLCCLGTLALVGIMTACTHTETFKLQPDYAAGLAKQNALSEVQPVVRFARGQFADKRADISKLATFKQGMHTFNVFAGRPVEDAVFEGLTKLVAACGHEWVEPASAGVRVDLQILSASTGRNAGFVSVGASSAIQIKLDFIDAKTSQSLYSEVYNGKDERERAMIGTMSMVEESMDAAIVDCVNAVGKDQDLAKALMRSRT